MLVGSGCKDRSKVNGLKTVAVLYVLCGEGCVLFGGECGGAIVAWRSTTTWLHNGLLYGV